VICVVGAGPIVTCDESSDMSSSIPEVGMCLMVGMYSAGEALNSCMIYL
jgi:hypothetical protein